MIKSQYDINAEVDARLEALEDKKLHENEIGFDMFCEKYVDDCAMRAMPLFLAQDLDLVRDFISHKLIAEQSYIIAEAMLEEKLRQLSLDNK
jgi:hypothetical protein